MAVRFAGDIFLGANQHGADDSDPGKYTSDNYLAAINRGGFDFGSKDSRTRWADVQDVDNNGYGDLLTPAARARIEEDKSNPLYQKAAQELGIKRFGSANDMAQVVKHLSEQGKAPNKDESDDDGGEEERKRDSSDDHRIMADPNLFRFG